VSRALAFARLALTLYPAAGWVYEWADPVHIPSLADGGMESTLVKALGCVKARSWQTEERDLKESSSNEDAR
jgi:hypothetical protein